jgi:hypothetical protein
MAIPLGLFKFHVTPEGSLHEVMDPPLIAHCETVFPVPDPVGSALPCWGKLVM